MAKYSKEIADKIYEHLEDGLCQKDAALLAGISEDTFYEWLNTKPEFSELVKRGTARYKLRLVVLAGAYCVNDGKLAWTMLTTRWPKEYGERSVPPEITQPIIKEGKLKSIQDTTNNQK